MTRAVKEFRHYVPMRNGYGGWTDPVRPAARLQEWLDVCEADTKNVYDIGEPIALPDGSLIVMYNVEPVSIDPDAMVCTYACITCGAGKKHYCRTCDAGKLVQ